MTSGPGAYWLSGQVTKVTTGTAGLVIDQNTKYQACTMCHTQIHGSNFSPVFFR